MRKLLILSAVVAIGAGLAAWQTFSGGKDGAHVDVAVSELSTAGRLGARVFEENCAACHGVNGAGTDQGPPLVHIIYEPSHHGDASFVAAVRVGVRQHHWKYGNMPRQPQITDRQIGQIIAYVRELQRANGIN